MKREYIRNYLIIILILICSSVYSYAQNKTNQSFPHTDIIPNQIINSPITIEINSLGLWMAHEGELGHVTLFDESGEKLATAIMKSKDGEWMVSGDAHFLAELNFKLPNTSAGKLRFENRVITSEGNNKKEYFEVPVSFYQVPVKAWYFGEQKQIEASKPETNFHFIKLEVSANNSFHGIEIYAPDGTDGSRSALQGNFSDDTFFGTKQLLAEGEIYLQEFSLKLQDNSIELEYNLPSGEKATLPKLTESEYDSLLNAFETKILLSRMNTGDRNRLDKMDLKNRFGFNTKDLVEINFLELEINLDGSYDTREFLLYPYGSLLCGTGGCTLFVVNDDGKILSQISVAKMPVYTNTNRAIVSDMIKPGWKDLFVWSNGAFRRLVFKNNFYTPNASVAPAMAEENLELNPQNFIKIMDFID